MTTAQKILQDMIEEQCYSSDKMLLREAIDRINKETLPPKE